MSDPRPYVPREGRTVTYYGRQYKLREVDGTRLLFNLQGRKEATTASYRLQAQDRVGGEYFHDVFSIRTGKKMPRQFTSFMCRVHRDRPLPKFPLWKEDKD